MDIMIITISNNNPKALQGSKYVFILIAVAGAIIHLLLLFFCIFQMFCNNHMLPGCCKNISNVEFLNFFYSDLYYQAFNFLKTERCIPIVP